MRKKPLDLSKPVQTGDGRPARIVATLGDRAVYPLVVVVTGHNGREWAQAYTRDGALVDDDVWRPGDLVNVPNAVNASDESQPARMKVVYVAGPFRGASHWEIAQNIRRAEVLALEVWRAGYACICPHANTRNFQGAASDSIWLTGDIEILRRCDGVLMTPDWERSSGAREERRIALQLGIPVVYSLEDLKKTL